MAEPISSNPVEAFGELVRHPGEEYVYVLDGSIEVHTEFYDPVVLEKGESIYLDSQMGHAYVVAEGCDEATVLGVCSSADESLMSSLLNLHGSESETEIRPAPTVRDLRPREGSAPISAGKRRVRAAS